MNISENVNVVILVLCAILVGVSITSQAGVTSQLRVALHSPAQAGFLSFLIGAAALGVVCVFQGNAWFKSVELSNLPWWAWLGGLMGAFNIFMVVYLAPKLGALVLTVSIVFGQVVASLLFDHNGWLGFPTIELSLPRIAGAVLIICGIFLAAKG